MSHPNGNGQHAPRRPVIGISSRSDKTTNPVELNTYSANQSYVKAVIGAGGAPTIIPLGMDDLGFRAIFDSLDAVLLPGGGDVCPALYAPQAHQSVWGIDDDRDRLELALVRMALAEGKPVLAICRGLQIMNVAMGGTLYQDISAMIPGADEHFRFPGYARDYLSHTVLFNEASHVPAMIGLTEVKVNSMHHQSVWELGRGLLVTGRAPDGVVEAIEAEGHPFAVGLQFHPEELTAYPHFHALFKAFVAAALGERLEAVPA